MTSQDSAISKQGAGLLFHFSEKTNQLLAKFTLPEERAPIDDAWLRLKLLDLDFDHLWLDELVMTRLIEKYNAGESGEIFIIGERRDASLRISITKNEMAAYLHYSPAYGGEPVTREQIQKLLKDESIVFGVHEDAIEEVLKAREELEICVAQGTPVRQGEETRFELLLPRAKDRRPVIREDDTVDYRNLGDIFSVRAGEKLMRRIPAVPGRAGKTITGQKVSPPEVVDVYFGENLEGAEPDKNDKNLLRSVESGQPLVLDNGVVIEKIYRVDNVDMASGNIKFDGTLEVAGDVTRGMKIEVSGDVVIHGMVEAAQIQAGGDVSVEGTVIGSGDVRDAKGNIDPETAFIQAGGMVSVRSAEHAVIRAEDAITIRDLALDCEVWARNSVIIGGKGGGKGQVMGGLVHSGYMITANKVGSPAGVRTRLEINADPAIHDKYQEAERLSTELELRLRRLDQLFMSMQRNPQKYNEEMVVKTIEERSRAEGQLKALTKEKERLKQERARVKNGRIKIESMSHAGAVFVIGKNEKAITEDIRGITYRQEA